ncbi:MAG TPA: glycosyltransferase family 4 protein [Puia sp.]|jgi:glycosyltransferase involved in cell wall biosynthesis|nr:glycosyltransferase family 4 protein [Puia sp.]
MASIQRIAFVANTSWSIYKFRLYVIGKLVEKGFDVYVLAPRDPYTSHFEHLPGLTYIELRHYKGKTISPAGDILLYKELLQHYRRLRPSLIFHYTIKANIFGSMAASAAGIPAISVITGLGYAFAGKGWLQSVARILYRSALRRTKEVWFLNEDDRRIFVAQRLVPAEKTFILPGEGVDSTAFYPAPFEAGRKETTFLLIARIIRHKGIYEFAEAAGQLRRQGLPVRCQLLGVFDDDNPVAIPRQEVDEWEQKKILTYLGQTDDVPPFIDQADCIVLPSYREGLPLSLLEGASMAKALIAADTPGCRTLIEDGINGFLCREKDGADLARKMTDYYRLPAATKRQMGLAGRDKVLREFTREHILEIYLQKICIYCC